MKAAGLILYALSKFLELIENLQRKKELANAKDNQSKIDDDAAGYLADQYGGVRDNTEVPEDAERTRKTDD